MKTYFLHIVWCTISGEAAGEIWHWSLLWVKGLKTCLINLFSPFHRSLLCSNDLAFICTSIVEQNKTRCDPGTPLNPFPPKFKNYILPTYQREMQYKWFSEIWQNNHLSELCQVLMAFRCGQKYENKKMRSKSKYVMKSQIWIQISKNNKWNRTNKVKYLKIEYRETGRRAYRGNLKLITLGSERVEVCFTVLATKPLEKLFLLFYILLCSVRRNLSNLSALVSSAEVWTCRRSHLVKAARQGKTSTICSP